MRSVTLRFINDLRTAGLRISVSESMDAMQAVAAVGLERELLREALAASLGLCIHTHPAEFLRVSRTESF